MNHNTIIFLIAKYSFETVPKVITDCVFVEEKAAKNSLDYIMCPMIYERTLSPQNFCSFIDAVSNYGVCVYISLCN